MLELPGEIESGPRDVDRGFGEVGILVLGKLPQELLGSLGRLCRRTRGEVLLLDGVAIGVAIGAARPLRPKGRMIFVSFATRPPEARAAYRHGAAAKALEYLLTHRSTG